MAIRKTGAVTGEVTGVDRAALARQATIAPDWDAADDQALAAENLAADQADG